MAATLSPARDASVREARTSPIVLLLTMGLALACAACGLVIVQAYPIRPLVATGVFVACVAFAIARPSFALPAMLALMPIVDFAPRTGWLIFEEFDLLVLATAAGGYAGWGWRGDGRRRSHREAGVSIFAALLIAFFLVSSAIALWRAIDAGGGLRLDWYQGYDDPLNGLRIFKSFAFATLLLPLVVREARRNGGLDRIGLGFTIALGLGSLAVLQERLAFTGLLDFSDDYRVTGSFWEMHVGGAALDGFLALTIPFAVREAVRHTDPIRIATGLGTLALASYACLVTFSRGVYVAVPLLLLVLTVLVFRQRLRIDRGALWPLLFKGALFALAVAVSGFMVFRGGGYRAVLAAFAVLALAIPVEGALRRTRPPTWVFAVIVAAVLGAAGAVVASFLPKGPYVVFALVFVLAASASARSELDSARTPTIDTMAIAAWVWLAIAACVVSNHWGGEKALHDSAIVMAVLVALAFVFATTTHPIWPGGRREQLATVGFAALVMGSVAIFTGGAYMGGRFSTSRGDLDTRLAHWRDGLSRLRGVDDWVLGKGLGRFPITSMYDAADDAFPGSYRLTFRNGETFVALSGPRIKYLGFGELFRFSQQIELQPRAKYVLTIEARSASAATLHIEMCEKHLLYNAGCSFVDPAVPAGLDRWQKIVVPMDTRGIRGGGFVLPKPVFFAVAVANPGVVAEIRSIRLVGPGGTDVLANGDFAQRTARWFSSSDKYHLPWHIKNIALALLFDQGVFGLVTFVLLVGGAWVRMAIGRARRHPDAPFIAASITGFLVVGVFDSLLDVPRLACLFYVVTMLGLMLRSPGAVKSGSTGRSAKTSMPDPAIDAAREAAARAERRKHAFGERHR